MVRNRESIGWILRLAVAVLPFLVAPTPAPAADSQHPIRFEHLTMDDGLSQSTVLDVFQDADGLLWLGTENGLNRYDGYEIKTYYRERGNDAALSSDFVYDIEQDADGNLWIATNGGGLVRLDRATGEFATYRNDPASADSIAGNVVRRILIDDDGIVWAAVRGAGLDRLLDPETGTFEHFTFGADSSNPDNFYALAFDADGALWAGGDAGLVRLDPESRDVTRLLHDPARSESLGAASIRAIAFDSAGRLWVGSDGDGLSRMRSDQRSFDHFVHSSDDPRSLSGDRVTAIFSDSDKRLWVGTTRGLNLVEPATGKVVRYQQDNVDPTSLGGSNVTSIYQDRSGLLWFGTKTRGVSKWNPRTWQFGFEPAENLTENADRRPNVTSFVEDASGTLWVGTFGDGLNAWDRSSGEVQRYRKSNDEEGLQIADDRVMSLMRDSRDRIWVGTMTAGITVLDPKSGDTVSFSHDPENESSLGANGIMAMFEDRNGLVWVGTFGGGISRFDPAKNAFTRFLADADNPTTLSSNRVTSFAEDNAGRIWVGTESGGLNLYDPKTSTFHAFRHDPSDPQTLAADTVYTVNIDAKGQVWVGTHGGGLDRVVGDPGNPDSVRFENIARKHGLANDVVYGVQFDDLGRVWASTNYGISRYNPTSGEFSNLGRGDGLQSDEFNFGAHYRSDSGELFFGGHNGLNAFQPESITQNSVAPLIALTGFFNSNDPLKSDLPDDTEGVELGWQDDTVSFEFAALDFASPGQNRYMYKLEGFDPDWIDLGPRRRITYTDLNDGEYLLRVRAANSEGVWSESDFTLPVHVAAAPWDTWWAYTIYLALAVSVVGGTWRGWKRKLEREEEYSHRLEAEVQARTETLLDRNEQLKELNRALEESSFSDPLTGLRNRRFVFEEVPRTLENIKKRQEKELLGVQAENEAELIFMMIDMDRFKPINDTYGHAAGDDVLLQFRDLLQSLCGETDIVVRWGGDEFMVIAQQARPGAAEALAERIRATVSTYRFILADGQIVRTTCSIGFAAYPFFRNRVDDSNIDQIIGMADNLMYEAKKKRDAWVGMLGPSDAVTSFDFDHDSIESTSILFRARHVGNLSRHESANDDDGRIVESLSDQSA